MITPRTDATTRTDASRRLLTKVPHITLVFWVLKLLTTGMGEAMSDSLGQRSVPLGASFADGFSKPTNGGLGIGDPLVSLIELVFFLGLVAWVTVSRRDVQADHDHEESPAAHRRAPHLRAVPHLPVVPHVSAAPHHHGEARHHGYPAPARLATELE